jgi:MFS family permease
MFGVYVLTNLDRGIVSILVEPLKRDLALSDAEIGFLIGPAFAISFIFAGLPLGRVADRGCRRNVLAACLLAWSAMTGCCAFAQGFMQLSFLRATVGIGEAGGPPAAISLISDIFSERHRTRAFAVFYAGAPIGVMAAFAGGALITSRYSWHAAFLAAALPGILLTLVIWLTVEEPMRGMADASPSDAEPPPKLFVARFIRAQRSLLNFMVAVGLFLLVGSGVMAFLASFLIRSYAIPLGRSGLIVSVAYGVGSLAGAVACGSVVDQLIQRDVRWRYRIPAIAAVLAALSLAGALLVQSLAGAAALLLIWSALTVCTVVPVYAAFQSLVPLGMRATMASIQFILSAVIGGFGPWLVGAVSQAMGSRLHAESLRYSLLLLCFLYLWASTHFAAAGRTLRADLKRALARE